MRDCGTCTRCVALGIKLSVTAPPRCCGVGLSGVTTNDEVTMSAAGGGATGGATGASARGSVAACGDTDADAPITDEVFDTNERP